MYISFHNDIHVWVGILEGLTYKCINSDWLKQNKKWIKVKQKYQKQEETDW